MEELRRHLRTPYFITSMKRSNVVTPLCGKSNARPVSLSIPATFIHEHGDKIQLRCTLQAEARGEVWSVNLWASAAHHEVKISTGWKAFASSNDLKKGDLLLFSLTAMSKFVVYIFDFAGSLIKEPRRARPLTSSYKICGCNCQDCKADWRWMSKNLPRNKQNEEISRFPGACSSDEMTHQHEPLVDCRVHAQTVTLEEECHPTRSLNGFDKTRISQQVHAKRQKTVFQKSSSMSPTFQKTLTLTASMQNGQLEVPAHFMRLHGHQLQGEMVTLQGPGGYQAVPIRSSVSNQPRTYFRGEPWRRFMEEGSLQGGDKLLFTLTGTSCFTVEIMSRRRPSFTDA